MIGLPSWFFESVTLALPLAEQSKYLFLVMGGATCVGGILMLFGHKREVDRVFADRNSSDALKRMEQRKYLRRAATSSMIAMIGSLIAGCFWVTERRVAGVFLISILVLVVAVAALAILDFMSVGVRALVAPNRDTEKAMLKEIVRRHEESKVESGTSESSEPPENPGGELEPDRLQDGV